MKKIAVIFVYIVLALSLISCGSKQVNDDIDVKTSPEIRVSTSENAENESKDEIKSDDNSKEKIDVIEYVEETEDIDSTEDIENIDSPTEKELAILQLFSSYYSENEEIGPYYETLANMTSLDYINVNGYELIYIDEDNSPELIVYDNFLGECMYIYTLQNGTAIPYNIGSEWMTISLNSEFDYNNGIVYGQGVGGWNYKTIYYLPNTGTFYYTAQDSSSYGDSFTEYYFDKKAWIVVKESGTYYSDDAGNIYEYDSPEVEAGIAKEIEFERKYDVSGYDSDAEWIRLYCK